MNEDSERAAPERRTALLPEPTATQRVYLELLRTHEAFETAAARFFKGYGVTGQQFNVLRILYVRAHEAGIPCSAIAGRLLNRVPDMTRLLDRLERAGLVSRARCAEDRRVVRAQLTAEGVALVERIHAPLLAFHDDLAGSLSGDEARQLVRLLERARTEPSE